MQLIEQRAGTTLKERVMAQVFDAKRFCENTKGEGVQDTTRKNGTKNPMGFRK